VNESWGRPVAWPRRRRAQFRLAVVVLLLIILLLFWRLWPNLEAIGALLVVLGGAIQLLLSAGPQLPDPSELASEERSPDRLTAREIDYLRARMHREADSRIDLALLMSYACVIFGGGLVFVVAVLR
jgi:hypothetical protein